MFNSSPRDQGWLGYVQMETMSPAQSITDSSKQDTPITYDMNNAFAPIHIFPAPGTPSIILAPVEPQYTPDIVGATFIQPVKIQLSKDFWYWPTIEITWDNVYLTVNWAINADMGTDPNKPTPGTTYTTAIDASLAKMVIQHNSPINATQVIVYNLSITNPVIDSTTHFRIRVFHRYNFNLTDYQDGAFNLTCITPASIPPSNAAITLDRVRLQLSWGIDPNWELNAIQTQFIGVVVSSNDITKRYQGLRFTFDLTGQLVPSSYTVDITICSDNTKCDVLENSIYHSFGSNAVCTPSSTATLVKITCTNITTIAVTNNYVAVRAFFDSSLVNLGKINDANLHKVTITWTDDQKNI
jgi:hypothetical protein